MGPHPKFGGERKREAFDAISPALLRARIATLQLHYVGSNERPAGPDAELAYARAALEELALHNLVDGSRMGLAGYAFGASMALRLAEAGAQIQAVAAIAPPARALTDAASAEMLANKLVVGAGEDHDLPVQQFRFLASRLSEPAEVEVIRDADHFFSSHAIELSEIVVEFFTRRLCRQPVRNP